jgi:hypothetical protein
LQTRILPCNSDLCGEKKQLQEKPLRDGMLLPQTETVDNLSVPIRIAAIQVVQQPAAPIDHHDQSAARSMIFRVGFEVGGEVVDALAQ